MTEIGLHSKTRIGKDPEMIKRMLGIWLVANFGIVGILSILRGNWYLGWSHNTLIGVLFQLGLVMLPNLILPILVLRFWWNEPVGSLRDALGWRWQGWRTVLTAVAGFILVLVITNLIVRFIGPAIPYNLPGVEPLHSSSLLGAIGLLLFMILYVGLTVAAEETLFRGLMQTQLAKYGFWVSLLLPALLFALRHLPDALFYGHLWNATPQMWLTQELQLCTVAITIGLVRHFGRSTFASATMHLLVFILMVL
jgi:membrane protease YdiL (CAAX protease family)